MYHLFWTALAFMGLILSMGVLNNGFSALNIIPGAMFGMVAAALYAAVVIAKYFRDIPPVFIVFMQTSIGMVMLLPFTRLSEVPLAGSHWICLVSLGVVHTALAYIFFYRGVQNLGTAVIAVSGFIDPEVAILLDILVYDQHIGFLRSTGIALILLSGIAMQSGVDRSSMSRLIKNMG